MGQALALTAMANLVVAAVSRRDVGVATGMNAVMRTVGMALGSALSAALLAGGTHPAAPSRTTAGTWSTLAWRPA